ncbi:MAG: pseudouridine synthase [Ferruginibacter sp.]
MPHRYFILHKPYNMVSQFISPHHVRLLGHLGIEWPAGIHAVGRLDNHSEGLLILTTNKKLTHLLFEAETPHNRTYWVQVNGEVGDEALQQLKNGVEFTIKNGTKYNAIPVDVKIIAEPSYAKTPPYFISNKINYTWLSLTLAEGKYHQVRKMMSAIHHRCRRLIRVSIEDLQLGNLQPGDYQEIAEDEMFRLLKIKPVS